MYPSFSPSPITVAQPLAISASFTFSPHLPEIDAETERYSFIQSDDWRLSGPADDAFLGYNDVSPVFERNITPITGTPPNGIERNTFLQKLLIASGRTTSVAQIDGPDLSPFGYRSPSPPSHLMLMTDRSPAQASPDQTSDQKYESVKELGPLSPLTPCPPTPTSVSAAPRFARKNAYFYGTPTRSPGKKLVLTPSCIDDKSLLDSVAEKKEESKAITKLCHRYRTRSKLASIRELVGLEEASYPRILKRDLVDKHDADSGRNSKIARQDDEREHTPTPPRRPFKAKSNVRTKLKSKAKSDASSSSSTYLELESALSQSGIQIRTFPSHVPYHPYFPLFYRRFPDASSSSYVYFLLLLPPTLTRPCTLSPNIDLYTPHSTHGSGLSKTGLCPICSEDVENGGEGRKLWLAMKCSAYKW